jgi:hypothetical protein
VGPPRTARSYNPRTLKFAHLNTNTRYRATAPATPRPYVPPLAPCLHTSPYREKPFAYAGFLEQTRLARTLPPLYVSARRRMAPLMLGKPITRYFIGPPSDYVERADLMDRSDKVWRDGEISKGVTFFENAPYHEDHCETRRNALLMSAELAKNRVRKWQQRRDKESVEHKAAVIESYKHDVYHLDEMFNKFHKDLRVVPVTNRSQSDVSLDKLPYI